MSNPALFLDRDGIINTDYGYVRSIKDFHFVPGIFDLVSLARSSGLPVFVVTNQSGIGRGWISQKDFLQLNNYMLEQFASKGLRLEGVYHCPHHPTEANGEYLKSCPCRKPNPGMITQAALEHDLDLSRSIIIGDKESDMLAGMAAGLETLIYIGNGSSATCTHSFQSVELLVKNWSQVFT
jgi:D-glycero-D-manno-heptose 1,7-bisphosphate phosphatase